jgi:hypothetical protein
MVVMATYRGLAFIRTFGLVPNIFSQQQDPTDGKTAQTCA